MPIEESNFKFDESISLNMKKLQLLLIAVILVGCKTQDVFKDVPNILEYKNEMFYHGDDVVAKLSSVELAYDDGRLVHEATFVLTDAGQNDHAMEILKKMHNIKPEWDVEVELKRE